MMLQPDAQSDLSILPSTLQDADQFLASLGADFVPLSRRFSELCRRLSEGRFHLAVLGQFKRGKSTFVNALLGEELLPTSVVPLTAIPTFIQHADTLKATITFDDHRRSENCQPADVDELRTFLARFVTESANPENKLGVNQVDVYHPAKLLKNGLVLIDTPGIGSTFRHNTVATLNFLPQCDAAVFVVSADPPPTEVEIEFLKQVHGKVRQLFFVLNKIDYISPDERQAALDFLRKVLHEQAGFAENLSIFSLSAKKGLESRQTGNRELWQNSGMADMEQHLLDFMASEKSRVLGAAVSQKAADLLDDVLMQLRLARRSLEMPLVELHECLEIFDRKLEEIDYQLQITGDILAGERKRLHELLEENVRQLRAEAEQYLGEVVEDALGSDYNATAKQSTIQSTLDAVIPEYFEKQNARLTELISKRMDMMLSPHQVRADELIETLRRTAANLFEIPYHAPRSDQAFTLSRRPYWVTRRWSTRLNPLPMSLGDSLFSNDRQRIRKRLQTQSQDLILSNVENLRWSLFQSIDDTFRRFSTTLAERLRETKAATHEAIRAAAERRQNQAETISQELSRLQMAIEKLERLQTILLEH
ncbi:MAG: Dynamin family protein [Xanthomonadaceae bacterium]|nr:Dynamin family protein [Xanthomonadaceae bacterium]